MNWGGNGDICVSMWVDAYASGLMTFPVNGWVLEVGCAEYDWIAPLKADRPDLHVVGIDWRIDRRAAATAQIIGDVLTMPLADDQFDAVVGVSSIEHIGLGHYDHDPLDVDGDVHCTERIGRWLKPGGWFYADVPYAESYRVEGTSHRAYDESALRSRLVPPGCRVAHIWRFPQTTSLAYIALLAVKE